MVPGVEMNFELHFNSPNFYTFSTLTSGTGVKRYVMLREQDVDITLHLCRLSLNPDIYSSLQDALQRAMDLSGIPTAPPAGVGVAPNVSSPSSGVPSVTTIRAAAQDLPSPTFSPRQIDVMERILRNVVPEDQIDALLDSVGLDNNQLADYIAQRPPSPTLSPRQIEVMERIARGNFLPGQIDGL